VGKLKTEFETARTTHGDHIEAWHQKITLLHMYTLDVTKMENWWYHNTRLHRCNLRNYAHDIKFNANLPLSLKAIILYISFVRSLEP